MATLSNINNSIAWQDTSDTWATTNTWASYANGVSLTNITA